MDKEKSDQPGQQRSRLIRGPHGLRMFPPRNDGRIIDLEMIEKAEVEMDIEYARAGGMIIPSPPEDGSKT